MLFNWVIIAYNWFMRSKPIVRFVINIGDDGITPMLNVKHKTFDEILKKLNP